MALSGALTRQLVGSIRITPAHLRGLCFQSLQFRWPLTHGFNSITASRAISTGTAKKTTPKTAAKPKATTKSTAKTKTKKPATTAKSATTKKTPTKKSTTATKKRATTKKKAATKKAAPKKAAPKKAAPKKAAPKKAARKKKKVELTDEQKRVQLIKRLRVKALHSPPRRANGYMLYGAECRKDEPKISINSISTGWNALSQEKKDAYAAKSHELSDRAKQDYEKWIQSQPVDTIRKANNARRQLKNLGLKHGITPFRDDRQIKRPRQASALYVQEQYRSGRVFPKDQEGHQSVVNNLKLLRDEFANLSASDRKLYEDMAARDKERYEAEKAMIGKE